MINVLWNVMPYNLEYRHQGFGTTCCLHLLGTHIGLHSCPEDGRTKGSHEKYSQSKVKILGFLQLLHNSTRFEKFHLHEFNETEL
jgi:hypothetical protein